MASVSATRPNRTHHRLLPLRSWLKANVATPPQPMRHSIVTLASYMTVGTIAIVAISSLFCLFMAVSMVDDVLRITAPDRLWLLLRDHWLRLDWTHLADKLSEQLTSLAEWERQKRAAWYPYDHPSYHDGDRFHDLLFAATHYLNEYVQINTKKTKK
ncbi:hypothetical protein PHYBLDRAFT_172040 [Phycomyces blakesleeanus NRRL 1555(-)]|uniref:Uncharacterized protein n=1 Tax=Phycomyces blakesleeanus (strain ATCC 8743b / DSM 1359 / FGSC 10004 / NBRC 33097 / NRRL 1555) TaxID=763407 RepID=A0A167LB06_PHYB8|nr:hypothetical protein PHYBLDRAFT_172040 [Phycomyces blakesleeanus NRRL 1555(-)]OAD70025.1 hypothetical protein PHYBLDRAFT_172040 [Phycomyces blakesleeanus NRRL 1555(-)]|eukprot:XP_018288065.1 hypothetical protein PHYBLDRAFT_172040 [Phycomyces blakesleeanus NRRL 1555(-)]